MTWDANGSPADDEHITLRRWTEDDWRSIALAAVEQRRIADEAEASDECAPVEDAGPVSPHATWTAGLYGALVRQGDPKSGWAY